MKTSHFWAALGCLAAQVRAKAVFAHFMVGNSKTYTQADWEKDIQLAKDAHIDAFALNVANEIPEPTPSLNLAFSVAASKGFKLFFSYDYAGLGGFSKDAVVKLCDDFCKKPAYYRFNGKPLLSTFEGSDSAEEWHEIKTRTKGFFVPDWPSQGAFGAVAKAGGVVDGVFNWAAWPWGNQDMDTNIDASYMQALNQSGGKPYMMAASPWFYTNLPEWDKNWLWRGDSLWFDRWNQILYNEPEFVEIISWNDFGESHHIGPLVDKAMATFHYGKAPFNYGAGYAHDGWRAFLPFVIDTYKDGIATATKEGLLGWWRRSAKPGSKGSIGPQSCVNNLTNWNAFVDVAWAAGSISATPTLKRSQMGCIQGTGTGNFKGLCEFNCHYNYCPISAWTCTALGNPIPEPQPQYAPGFPAAGLDENYTGLCAVACRLGYCPPIACSKTKQPLVVPTTSPFAPPACTKGETISAGELTGLCSYACNFGFCPRNVRKCTGHGPLNPPPAQNADRGKPREGLKDHGLCAFACSRGYCPGPVCVAV